MENNTVNEAVLRAARNAWLRGSQLRARRERYKRFTYGDQWSDLTVTGGLTMTTGDAARRHGREPMTNNLIRRMVKSVIGRYRCMRAEESPQKCISPQLKAIHEANNLDELDCRALEEFLISGCVVQRITRERRHHGSGVWVDNVSPARFFINEVRDSRGWDTKLIGMLHDMSVTEAIMRFAHGDRRRADRLRGIFANQPESVTGDGFNTAPDGMCRAVEVWTLECSERLRCHDPETGRCYTAPLSAENAIEADNAVRARDRRPTVATRWETVAGWHCRWLAPTGELLDGYDSPYPHRQHPFAFRLYPLIDGEVHSLVEDVIDQQVYVNRLITLIDHVIGTAAKGVLLFPADQKIDGMKWEEVGRLWGTPDGILPYRPRGGQPQPQQVASAGGDLGARGLLDVQMKMFEEVSGVSETLTGASPGSNMGAAHYESRVRNAVIAITDLLHTFANFVTERDKKSTLT